MNDMTNIGQCTSISELVDNKDLKKDEEKIKEAFEQIFDKTSNDEDFEAIVSVNKSNRTAVITPILRKIHLVDYESSEDEIRYESKTPKTPSVKLAPKTPKYKRLRSATPHVKKLLTLTRQKVVEEDGETIGGGDEEDSPIVDKTTPLRNEETSKYYTVSTFRHFSYIFFNVCV